MKKSNIYHESHKIAATESLVDDTDSFLGAVPLLSEIENTLQQQRPDTHIQIKKLFGEKTLGMIFKDSVLVVKTCLLAIIALLLPNKRELLHRLTRSSGRTPIGVTKEDVSSYLDAVIKSGVATDAHREMLYILGNTGTGKTSLAETYKSFFQRPDETPESKLTENDPPLLKTRIADVHKDMILPHIPSEKIQKEKKECYQLVSFGSYPDPDVHKRKKAFLKIVDFGGHQV